MTPELCRANLGIVSLLGVDHECVGFPALCSLRACLHGLELKLPSHGLNNLK